eukprot:Em0013g530a
MIKAMGFNKHFPEQEMACTAKLSSLCYNTYHKVWLLSSDYDGAVCVWDTSTRLVKFQVRDGQYFRSMGRGCGQWYTIQ